ncbi:HNH endonuclease [Kosakonia sacchari]|uniref:HNH endonuclease n=1 Tax=Kosakonia sacchari TaxID=1158459 RepID=A0A1G4XFQ3_9ENTR|nr:HNH endonuclease signature motif containing protein [Kosakonia sacchari]AHJ74565.1 hypothetical protein C813_07300 [Kosakonia sacchari SP1]SCX40039.1 HNH endonuclease [Kosakonia sacchari]
MAQQAWSFKAIEKGDLRYWGNDGYHDDSSVFYRYNDSVPNHKKVKQGDIVIIRDREKILGVSIIEKLETRSTNKIVYKCPHMECNAKKIRPRETIKPRWRCDKGHEFDERRIVLEPATEFIANYGSFFKELKDVSLLNLETESPRYNIQLSIQEVNLHWAKELIGNLPELVFPLNSEDAENDQPDLLEGDQRKIAYRQIKQRRGQKTFRDKLLKSNPICAVTGCELVDILEAAHIDAYRNDSHNHISNGLLLRSDIHTLFDLGMIAFNPKDLKIYFSEEALKSGYKPYHGIKLVTNHSLSKSAILKRWLSFRINNDTK